MDKTRKKKGGFFSIFRFTLQQRLKTPGYRKATIGGALLCFLLPLIIMGCVEAFGGKGQKAENKITTVFVDDETGLSADYTLLNQLGREGFTSISYEMCSDFDTAAENAADVENAAILVVQQAEESDRLSVVLPEQSNLSVKDLSGFEEFIGSAYSYIQMQKTGLSSELLTELTTSVSAQSHKAANAEEDSLAMIKEVMSFVFPYINIMLLYFLVLFYGQGTSTSVLLEKTSKLMDTFLLTTKPEEMVLGKVLATVLTGTLQVTAWVGGMAAGFWGGTLLVHSINPDSDMLLIRFFETFGSLSGMFTWPSVAIAFLQIFAGFLLYCSLAAIGGAVAGKQEELSTTNMMFTFALIISFFAVLYTGGLGSAADSSFWLNWVPFTAVLIVPSRVLLGQISVPGAAASLLVALICAVVICVLAGKLYRTMALYKGKVPKLAELVLMMRKS